MDRERAQLAAQRLLAEPDLMETVFATLRQKYVEEWTVAGEINAREALWLRVQALGDFERELRVLADNALVEQTPAPGDSAR